MTIIGITGGTGAGKTTALSVLRELGADVLDCDRVYHDLLERSAEMLDELQARFPAAFVDGSLDRRLLAGIVFEDPVALSDLNSITHTYVSREVDTAITASLETGAPAFAVDAIALIEAGLGDRCDAVVGIVAPQEVRVRRIMDREGISREYAERRVKGQKPEAFFRENCDFVLKNDGGEPSIFITACRALFTTLIEKEEKHNGEKE